MPTRRQLIAGTLKVSVLGALATIATWFAWSRRSPTTSAEEASMKLSTFPLGFQWPTQEPFLFCVHHLDLYPKGTAGFGPDPKLLVGRDMGQDFEGRDGFRMYHGEEVPGFPVHPHRGFETVTIVRKGYVDHADSLGAAGRYGEGDVQWMTAGAGVQHSEMFPLLKPDGDNTLELFQIWLNLPKRSKMVPAHFTMFWSEKIPRQELQDGKVSINLIAGKYQDQSALKPPPDSWASDSANEVMILLVKMKPGGHFDLPASLNPSSRSLYFFEGHSLKVNGETLDAKTGANLDGQEALAVNSPDGDVEFLILQARPIGEPRVQHGPFVMNTREEIIQTFEDFQRTQFGGWKWPRHDMVHGSKIERFAKFPDGRIEKPVAGA